MALEAEFWSALGEVARARELSLSALVVLVDAERDPEQPLASALRLCVLRIFRQNR